MYHLTVVGIAFVVGLFLLHNTSPSFVRSLTVEIRLRLLVGDLQRDSLLFISTVIDIVIQSIKLHSSRTMALAEDSGWTKSQLMGGVEESAAPKKGKVRLSFL